MTLNDIYKKFLIEYDKDGVTSSYPSLTDHEIATFLDKAYLALISQKLTANNPRKTGFESDSKSIEDIRPLIRTVKVDRSEDQNDVTAINEILYDMPKNTTTGLDDMLYYIQGVIKSVGFNYGIDGKDHVTVPVMTVSHEDSQKFKATAINLPWIPKPVVFLENNKFHILYDTYKYTQTQSGFQFYVTYVKKPLSFVNHAKSVTFELSDSMAEELVNLAILFATKPLDQNRMSIELNTRALES